MKKLFYLLLSATMFITACTKDEAPPQGEDPIKDENPVEDDENDEDPVVFDVKLSENRTYKVGEEVEFIVDGKPVSIDFFSGQAGHEYKYRDGKVSPSGMSLNFSLHKDREESAPTLSLLVSTDFDGEFGSFESVAQQNWIDVTDRMTFPEAGKYAEVAIDFSDLTVVGKPFYFAIKYKNILTDDGLRLNWTLRLPEWHSVLSPDQRELIGHITGDENTMGFELVSENPDLPIDINVQVNNPDRFNIRGHMNDLTEAESWIVSKVFNDVQEIPGDPDVAITIEDAQLPKYSHIYTMPGTYTAHFIASVKDENGEIREEVKEIQFVVEL